MYGVQDLSGNPAQAAAVQLALWDLALNNHNPTSFTLQPDGSYSAGDGSVFDVRFNFPLDAAAIAPLVNQYLQGSIGATVQGGWLNAAANGTGPFRGESLLLPGPWFNFGNFQSLPVTISGVAYQDANGNGVFDAGEAGMAGVTVSLSGTDALGQAITATTITAADGTYSFTTDTSGNPLPPGIYQVTETPPSGCVAGTTSVGTVNGATDGTVVSTGTIGSIVLTSGQNGINYNFAELEPVTIAGMVYQDLNGNGALDAGEPGFANVTLTLTGTNGQGQSVTATTVTAADGSYTFSTDSNGNVLLSGTYQITETTPAGYVQVAANVGMVNSTLDGREAAPGQISAIVMAPGQNGSSYDFGVSVPAAVSGYVYVDYNRNQVMDSADAGFASATVTLTGTDALGNSVSLTTTTDVNGHYIFAGLLSGTYSVILTPPGGNYNTEVANVGTVNGSAVGAAGSTTDIDQVQLLSGQIGLDYDFGLTKPLE
jgi:hypothetical protein